jgi:hypothetical protein
MLIVTIASFISAMGFTVCTFTALFFALMGDLGSSLGFALIAGIWFVLMVTLGYAYINRG